MKAKKSKRAKKLKIPTASSSKTGVVLKTAAAKKASRNKSKAVSKISTNKTNRKPTKSPVWKISPEKFGATDVWVFKKDGLTIGLSQNYRFSFLITAQKPNLTKYDPDKGVNIDKFKYFHLESGDDARGPDWIFPDGFPLKEQERIKRLWDEDHQDGMSKEGWIFDVEGYFYGPLSVEEVSE
jgi:hypothetical protein